jgi:uncharacterized membrane protein
MKSAAKVGTATRAGRVLKETVTKNEINKDEYARVTEEEA